MNPTEVIKPIDELPLEEQIERLKAQHKKFRTTRPPALEKTSDGNIKRKQRAVKKPKVDINIDDL